MKRVLTALLLVSGMSGFLHAAGEAEEKREMEYKETCFVVIGDIHYFNAHASAQERMRALREDLRKKKFAPDLICQVGDVIENQEGSDPVSGEEGARQWRAALKDIKEVFPGVPFLIAAGNHDWYGNNSWFGGWENLKRYLLPFLEKELGAPLNGQTFYSLRCGDSLFLFTNHVGMNAGMDVEQREWLKKSLAAADANPAIRHVWGFGHCGLWNVNYVRFNENAELLPVFAASRKLKGYFTGHVHRNNITVWRTPGGNPVLQAVAAGFCPESAGVVQEARFLTLNPPPSARAYAAFPESCPSYCVVAVRGEEIRLRFEKIGGPCIADIRYKTPHRIEELAMMPGKQVQQTLPKEIRKLRLHLYPYFPERFLPHGKNPEIRFNGVSAGMVARNAAAWHVNHFRYAVELPPELLKKSNTLEITNPGREFFLIRDCQLEAVDSTGVSHFSALYPKVISAGSHRNIYMNFGLLHPECGILHSSLEYNVPDELIEDFPIDEPVRIKLEYQ